MKDTTVQERLAEIAMGLAGLRKRYPRKWIALTRSHVKTLRAIAADGRDVDRFDDILGGFTGDDLAALRWGTLAVLHGDIFGADNPMIDASDDKDFRGLLTRLSMLAWYRDRTPIVKLEIWLEQVQADLAVGREPKQQRRKPGEVARYIREYLRENDDATSIEIAKALHVTDAAIRKNEAWKNRPHRQPPGPGIVKLDPDSGRGTVDGIVKDS